MPSSYPYLFSLFRTPASPLPLLLLLFLLQLGLISIADLSPPPCTSSFKALSFNVGVPLPPSFLTPPPENSWKSFTTGLFDKVWVTDRCLKRRHHCLLLLSLRCSSCSFVPSLHLLFPPSLLLFFSSLLLVLLVVTVRQLLYHGRDIGGSGPSLRSQPLVLSSPP